MRFAGHVVFTLGILIFAVALLGHFAMHPGELADTSWVVDAVRRVPMALPHMSDHPSTVLVLVAVVLISISLILMKMRQRGHTRS